MIYVLERFFLKPELERDAESIMQRLDDLVGPAAHEHPGWCGHAIFLQNLDHPGEVLMLYPWRSGEFHEALYQQEEPGLSKFYSEFCSGPRQVALYRPLDIEVEHETTEAPELSHQSIDDRS